MDIKNFNKKLNKITALTENNSESEHLSTLERDLLLSYIRDLYDLVLEQKSSLKHGDSSAPDTKSDTSPMVFTSSVSQVIEDIKIPIEKSKTDELVSDTPKVESSIKLNPVMVETIEIPVQLPDPVVVPEQKQTPKPTSLNMEQLAELFADEKVTDLSDKLALTPVKDLTKSMGINERIFTQQELFGNNQQHFTETLQTLNNCQNFAEAKQYLLDNVIGVYDWTNDQKIKKASTFVKLVKRKFSTY
ncbi:MAG: hypothetical protein IPN86_21755 [Saprospiraceae bacterium]|nr:hypothetical protein [Saprospiraceae bacterium]